MKRKQIKEAFIKSMGCTEFWEAKSLFNTTLLRDIPFETKELHWNYVFYNFPENERQEMFTTFGYKDLKLS